MIEIDINSATTTTRIVIQSQMKSMINEGEKFTLSANKYLDEIPYKPHYPFCCSIILQNDLELLQSQTLSFSRRIFLKR